MKFAEEKLEIVVRGVYRSVSPDRQYRGDDYFFSVPQRELVLTTEGIQGSALRL